MPERPKVALAACPELEAHSPPRPKRSRDVQRDTDQTVYLRLSKQEWSDCDAIAAEMRDDPKMVAVLRDRIVSIGRPQAIRYALRFYIQHAPKFRAEE